MECQKENILKSIDMLADYRNAKVNLMLMIKPHDGRHGAEASEAVGAAWSEYWDAAKSLPECECDACVQDRVIRALGDGYA